MVTIFCLPPILRHAAITLSFSAARRVSNHPHQFSTAARIAFPERTYKEAIKLLDTLQSNHAVVSAISSPNPRDANQDAIPEMLEWARRAGYSVSDLSKHGLRCVHVAGTKGKGSVCAMVESILMQYRGPGVGLFGQVGRAGRESIGKVGLYTSPHLITVRERIRIDGSPIPEPMFARYFFELWDRFSSDAPRSSGEGRMPGYFRYLTLLALHAFVREGVETAIVECGIGGEYDSTNILPPDAVSVSAITKLGIDHVGMLGGTIEEIAWHKAGIMKRGVPAFTVQQIPAAQTILETRALEKGVELRVAERIPIVENGGIKLGLEGTIQHQNARLAIAVSRTHLQHLGIPIETEADHGRHTIPQKFIQGLETVRLQGRCESREDGNGKILWLIDGAHTRDSIEATADWYRAKLEEVKRLSKPPTASMLIFNQQDRDAGMLVSVLMRTLFKDVSTGSKNSNTPAPAPSQSRSSQPVKIRSRPTITQHFNHAIFCQNTAFKTDVDENSSLDQQRAAAEAYGRLDPDSQHTCYSSVEEAVEFAREVSGVEDGRLVVLVTGSLHLVGGLLQVLER